MKKKTIIIGAVLSILMSCTKESDFVQILTKDNKKTFWLQHTRTKDNHLVYTNNQWIFYPNNLAKCLVSFNAQKRGSSVIMNVEGPSNYPWSYNVRDSILDIGLGVKYKVVNYKSDTISLVTKDGVYFVWIRAQER